MSTLSLSAVLAACAPADGKVAETAFAPSAWPQACEDDRDCRSFVYTPHPNATEMRDKLLGDGIASGMNCAQYAASIGERLDARLAEEHLSRS